MAKAQPKLSRSTRTRQAKLPERIPVELALLEKHAPEGENWLHEIKWGAPYRA
jgi:ATP-dependent DNA ligase